MNQHEVAQMMVQAHQDPVSTAAGRASVDDQHAEKDHGTGGAAVADTDSQGAATDDSRDDKLP